MKNLITAICLCTALLVGAVSVRAQSVSVGLTGGTTGNYPNYALATNIVSVAKNATNTAYPSAPNIASNWTYTSTLVPLPANGKGLAIIAQFAPAGPLIGTSNVVVGFDYSDGLTYTSTTTPLTITFANTVGSNVCATFFIAPTNFFGQKYLMPDYVANQGLTNGTLSLTYGSLFP